MYPEDRPRRSVRRESAGVTEEPKKKSGITLLAQVSVCAVLVLAAFFVQAVRKRGIFRAAGAVCGRHVQTGDV